MVSSGRRHHRETGWGAGEVTSDAAAPLCHVEDIHAKSCREKPRRDIRWSVPCRAPRAASPLAVASPMPPTHGGGLVERCVAICTWLGRPYFHCAFGSYASFHFTWERLWDVADSALHPSAIDRLLRP